MMDRRAFITIVGGSIVAASLFSEAQQTAKVPHEGLCLSTHSEISLAPHADAFIFVPAAVHDWATVVLGRTPTLSGEFVAHLGKLVYVSVKRWSLVLGLLEVLRR